MPVDPSETPGPTRSSPRRGGDQLDDGLTELLGRVPVVVGLLRRMEPPPGVFGRTFHEHGLGPRHARVLMVVSFRIELSVSAVAEQLDVSLPAASLLIGELDRAGLLTRVEDPRDRRRTLVRIHPLYVEAAAHWLEQRVQPWRATLSRLSARDRVGFIEGWRILHHELTSPG